MHCNSIANLFDNERIRNTMPFAIFFHPIPVAWWAINKGSNSFVGRMQTVYPTESTLAFDNATGCEMDSVGRHKKSSLIYSSHILLEFTFHVNEKLMCETIAPDHFWVLKANRWMSFYMKPLFWLIIVSIGTQSFCFILTWVLSSILVQVV